MYPVCLVFLAASLRMLVVVVLKALLLPAPSSTLILLPMEDQAKVFSIPTKHWPPHLHLPHFQFLIKVMVMCTKFLASKVKIIPQVVSALSIKNTPLSILMF